MSTANQFVVVDGGQSDKVIKGSPAWANRVRRRAKALVNQLDAGTLELAKILYEVWDTPLDGNPRNKPIYKYWGFDSLYDYAEQELNLHHKKAEQLKRIWGRLESPELATLSPKLRKRLEAVGWTKLREVVRVITVRNAEEWIERAEQYTVPLLAEAVREYLYRVEEALTLNQYCEANAADDELKVIPSLEEVEKEVPSIHDMNRGRYFPADVDLPERDSLFIKKYFSFTEDQLSNVKLAIERANEIAGGAKSDSSCLDLICTDFLATNTFGKKLSPDKIAHLLAKYERLLGMRIVAVDNQSGDILYGVLNLDQLAVETKNKGK